MSRPTRAAVLKLARAQIGKGESPHGSNKTEFGRWFGMNGVAWCAIFVSWVFGHIPDGLAAILGRGAYTPTAAKRFYDKGRWTNKPRSGYVVYFAWHGPKYDGRWRGICHTGLVEAVLADGRIVTIEGNVGDHVQRLVRSTRYVAGYGIPDYAPDPEPKPRRKAGAWVAVKTRKLNLRRKGSLRAPVIHRLSRGEEVRVISRSTLWVKVQHGSFIGYAWRAYLR